MLGIGSIIKTLLTLMEALIGGIGFGVDYTIVIKIKNSVSGLLRDLLPSCMQLLDLTFRHDLIRLDTLRRLHLLRVPSIPDTKACKCVLALEGPVCTYSSETC